MTDPFRKLLGMSATADAFRLLALTPGQRHPRAVLQALQSQLQRVDNHADHGSAEAETVRQRLYEAARVLLESGEGSETGALPPMKTVGGPPVAPPSASAETRTPALLQ